MVCFFIILLTVINISNSLALDFSFDYPREVESESEFEVEIIADTQENYDVKIYVFDDTQKYSEIYDFSRWRSPFTYITEAYPSNKKYKIISHYVGETELCAQLRKSGTSSFDKLCQSINVLPTDQSSQNQSMKTEKEEKQEKAPVQDLVVEKESEIIRDYKNPNEEVVILGSQNNVKKPTFFTKEQNLRIGFLYGFAFICIIIIVLLSLKRL